ncbi:MAG: DNA polymerase, partial [Candidatus Omnitrophica bacterium]|nr:DNA polymerase [Candidatus Omnitrophota bacterium]
MKKQKLFLIDGNSFCYRAFYAIRELSNSKGQPTNAIYGFVSMMNKIKKECKPDLLAIAFDLKGPTFRHEKYEKYKIHRKPMPDDLIVQIPIIKEIIKAYNIPIFELQGYEADDVLATIAKKTEKEGIKIWIVTGDKDALQLVNDNINVYNPNRPDPFMNKQTVVDKYGIEPKHIIDLLAIMGDASDNVPGVNGIGEKGATDLIKQYRSLEGVYQHIDDIKGKKKEYLINSKEQAYLSKELVILDDNVPIDIDLDKLQITDPNAGKLTELFKELEFKGLLKELIANEPSEKGKYELIGSLDKLDELVKTLLAQKEIAVDLESTGLDTFTAEIVGISFSWKTEQGCYVPCNLTIEMDMVKVLSKLKSVLENDKIKKIGHNIKYDRNLLLENGIDLKGISFDTMIASYILNPSRMSHNLDDVSLEYLNHKKIPIEELIGSGKNLITMKDVDVKLVSEYSCEDSDMTFRLKQIFEKDLKEKELIDLFEEIEMPLCIVLADMERQGIKIDIDLLSELSIDLKKKIDKLLKTLYEQAGEEFNVNSPKQLQTILFDKMKLPITKKTKTGPSTDESVLSVLAQQSDFAKKMLDYRGLAKLKSTYVD